MPNYYSSKHIIKILQQQGFLFISQKGSHIKYKKKGNPSLIAIIPANKKEIPYGTFRSILKQTQLSEKLFIKK